MSLTEKQRRFVEAYMGVAAGNATEAARLAGYKGNDNTLHSVGSENLRKPAVAAALAERVAADPLVAGREELQRKLTAIVRGQLMAVRPTKKGVEITEPSHAEVINAAEKLAKLQGLFIERHEHAHSGGEKPIRFEVVVESEQEARRIARGERGKAGE